MKRVARVHASQAGNMATPSASNHYGRKASREAGADSRERCALDASACESSPEQRDASTRGRSPRRPISVYLEIVRRIRLHLIGLRSAHILVATNGHPHP